jgi:flagellar basal-body rod protein FlgB
MNDAPMAVVMATKALDGLSMRMAAIAQNIANANSARYQPVRLRFEEALSEAARRGPAAVAALQFSFEAGPVLPAGDDRRLDLALADAAATAGRFEALADMTGRRLALQHILMASR